MSETRLSIDANLLAKAQAFYASHGFIDTPTPWLVGPEAYAATCPPEVAASAHEWHAPPGGYHVASAEQGFIQLLQDGTAFSEKAQSTAPCFRWEAEFDTYHLPFFYKLELYDATADSTAMFAMISLAKQLFSRLGVDAQVEPLSDGSIDLVDTRGVELGSYGIRHVNSFSWVYGTGIALPRFSQCRDSL